MLKNKSFTIQGTVFPVDVHVSFGETDDQLRTFFLGKHGFTKENLKNISYNPNGGRALCVLWPSNQGLIRMQNVPDNPEDWGFLQHEITHYVHYVMKRLGVKDKSNETHAYFTQFITTEIYKHIWAWIIKDSKKAS